MSGPGKPVVSALKKTLRRMLGVRAVSNDPLDVFQPYQYLRHNQRRLEHLASLGLELAGASVLEVGAGIGDHTPFFLARGCRVVTTEPRPENLNVLRRRFPRLRVLALDLDDPGPDLDETFDVVYCYGVLYHLHRPAGAIEYMARHCRRLLLLETCVSFGDEEALNPCDESAANPSQAVHGRGCRPTRPWVFAQLKRHFAFVHVTATQPDHEEFPLDWRGAPGNGLTRAVFVASRQPLSSPLLVDHIPGRQARLAMTPGAALWRLRTAGTWLRGAISRSGYRRSGST